MKEDKKGITLIALIITIIVMLILVGVSVSVAINGGLFSTAQMAVEQTEIAREKEIISQAIWQLQAEGKEITEENLKEEINNVVGREDIGVEKIEENDFLVTFPNGRIYEVEESNIEYVGEKGKLEDIIIKVNREKDLEEKQIQEVEVTIKTYNNREENKTVKLQYAWNNDKETKPSSYKIATLKGNNISQKATISSGEQETGKYYLWIRVTVDGKTIEKIYGEYYIKKYPTLVRASDENNANSGFLGNTKIQRGKIKTITLQNTLEGKSTDESKCWDVSEAKNGEILAWYEEENIGENTYYNVTIGAEGKIRANEYSDHLFTYIGNNVTGAEVKIEGLENLDTSRVKSMEYMFSFCKTLKNLDLKSFDTRSVENLNLMFYYCESLTNLDLSSFDTRRVTTMQHTFGYCKNLVSLDVSKFDTSSVRTMYAMFNNCSSLPNLDLSSFNTENVTGMDLMFRGCGRLTNLDLSNFNTIKVTNMEQMFEGCTSLERLNIRNWKFNNAVKTSEMFDKIKNDIVITVSSKEVKDKLMSLYNKFTDSNFKINE